MAAVEWIASQPGFTFTGAFLNGAAAGGHMGLLEFGIAKGLQMTADIFPNAAAGGNVDIIQFAISKGLKRNTANNLAQIALANGQGAMFQFVCEKFNYQIGMSALANMLESVKKKGEFSKGLVGAMAALRDKGCSGHESVIAQVAATRASVDDLEALRAAGFQVGDAPLKAFIKGDPQAIAKLDWMVSQGAPCTVSFLQEMIPRGDMDVIAHAIKIGFPAEPSIYVHAAWANRLDMFPVFEERGVSFPYESDSMRQLLQGKSTWRGPHWDWHWWWWHPFWVYHTNPWEVPDNVVEALRAFHDHGLAFPEDLFHMCLNTCRSDKLFDYLLEAGAPFNQEAIKTARARSLNDLASRMENQSVF